MKTDPEDWKRFAAGDPDAKERLVSAHMGLVHDTARRLGARLSDEVAMEDIVSSGMMGLLRAFDRYDPGMETAFSTYAVPKIRGAILDDLRSKDPASRSLRQHEREIRETVSRLEQELGRAPTDQECADAIGIDIRSYWRRVEALAALRNLPIDQRPPGVRAGEGVTLGEILSDGVVPADEEMIREERRKAVLEAIRELPAQEKLVLTLSYYEELKLAEIADVLGVTESRVSQIRTRAVSRLRERFAA